MERAPTAPHPAAASPGRDRWRHERPDSAVHGAAPRRAVTAVSVAAPAFNEAEGIRRVVLDWLEYLKHAPGLQEFEIVICDDGSRDETWAILEELARQECRIKPVRHSVNQGAAAALTTAIRHTTLPWVLILESDGQYGVENLSRLIHAVETGGTCAAIGMRLAKRDTAFTRVGSRLSNAVCNWIYGTRYRDFFCALMLVDGAVLRSLPLEAKGLNYSGDITSQLIEAGVRPPEVAVEHLARTSGRSSAQSLRAARHRLLFVLYLGFRHYLLRQNVLQRRCL